jgi:hypothetical protein
MPPALTPGTEFPRFISFADSSAIVSMRYNPQARLLRVFFRQTRTVWEYTEVWPSEFAQLAGSYSVGKAFNELIRPIKKGHRVYPEPGQTATHHG